MLLLLFFFFKSRWLPCSLRNVGSIVQMKIKPARLLGLPGRFFFAPLVSSLSASRARSTGVMMMMIIITKREGEKSDKPNAGSPCANKKSQRDSCLAGVPSFGRVVRSRRSG